MTATFAELMFSVFFLAFTNAGIVFAFLLEYESLCIARALVARAEGIRAWSFPLREERQATGQPGLNQVSA